MPDLLIPVGLGSNHFFTPDALQKAVASAEADHPGKSNILKGTVDSNGAQVVLVMASQDGKWKLQTAFSKDWQGHSSLGASGSIAW